VYFSPRCASLLVELGLELMSRNPQAAQRRLKDDKACAHDSHDAEAEAEAARKSSEVIIIDEDDTTAPVAAGHDDDDELVILSGPAVTTPVRARPPSPHRRSQQQARSIAPLKRSRQSDLAWACRACTLENTAALFRCEVCDTPRPDFWACPQCGLVQGHERWMCVSCETIKQHS
jgi:hypothetical protein